MKTKIKNRSIVMFSITALTLLGLSSCLPLAAGAAAGYVAHDEGYRVRSPIKKTH
jgi:hypothetical protein